MLTCDVLIRRAAILRGLRAFFDARGFTEVETAVRIAAPAPEPHIDCPPCGRDFLRASPELQMKKLLAAGLDRIYQIGPCFRDGERGTRHNPEFTMIEWYRRGADYLDILADTEALYRTLAAAAGRAVAPEPFARVTVREAYAAHAGWDPWTDWDADRFDVDMATKVEPALPRTPVFLTDYPPQAASLARLRGDVAERWEFYADGIELANCFTELCDADEQRRRFETARDVRRACGEAAYPPDEDFLATLGTIGSAAGVALGVDRLVMVLLGMKSIGEVSATAAGL